jgi:plasmid stability protein
MGQLTVRDVDDAIIAALKARAAANGRSMEAEHRLLLREALTADRAAIEDFKAAAARLRARIGAAPTGAETTTDLLRVLRDER